MTPDQWSRIKELFQCALELAPHQRAAFLTDACAGQAEVRREVESLLAAQAQAGSFIETPALAGAAAWLTDEPDDAIVGQQIGPYQVIRALGHGGMGSVYLAMRADDQYQKQVAIKLVQRGMGTRDMLRRFWTERQILASLDHPHIAKLLDGGATADGLPYLVMDYVEGVPIDEYCDQHTLSTVERLRLFRTVCSAVHYAHQHLVIHRDLKPSNVLVTADGVPKLLDFGIAKLLTPEQSAPLPTLTATGLQPMTLEYASPEQVRGEPITTSSDVYALGVVLYELLTGHRPYRWPSSLPHDLVRSICEEEPQKPSTAIRSIAEIPRPGGTIRLTPDAVSRTRDGSPEKLRRRLAGDLDNIVLMALRKEPQRRYRSVEHLAEDLHRYLEGLPVMARPQTLRYRSAKFITRHKTGVLAAVLLAVTLVGGLVSTTWQARVAEAERTRAERRFQDVHQLANVFMFEFHDAIEKLPGSTAARELVVRRALEYLDSLAQEARGDLTLQRELATAYAKIGNIQWNRYYANLGDTAGALESHRKALAMRKAVAAQRPTHEGLRRDLAHSYILVGDTLAATGDLTGALEHYRLSLALREALAVANPANAQLRHEVAVSYQRLGDTLGNPRFPNLGDTAGALESYHKMLALFEAAAPTNTQARHSLSIGYEKMGDMLIAVGDTAGALERYRQALTLREALSATDPTNAQLRRDVAVGFGKIGDMLAAMGDHASALQSYRETLTIRQALAAADPTNAAARLDLARIYGSIGRVREALHDHTGAVESYREGLAIFEALSAMDATNRDVLTAFAQALHGLAKLLSEAGRLEEARNYTRRLLAMQQAQAEQATATAADRHAYAQTLLTCVPADLQDPAAALRYAQQAVAMTHGQDATLLDTLARAYYRTGDPTRALETVEQALALSQGDAAQRRAREAQRARFRTIVQGEAAP